MLDSKFRTDLTEAQGRRDGGIRSAGTPENRGCGSDRAPFRQDWTTTFRLNTSVAVTACIVLWGPARVGMPETHVVDGVHFVDGSRLEQWLATLQSSPV